ncbi:DnaJ-class molecular chaperone [Citrifermentans bremense]|uniref:DnaJ-class molecular chaperone n=1 Tax=Citrifermentans bremense TaxID=60035 RepID=A0A6S6MB31_9BACT|nr:J domain-containing protein [Citrifermentans bremense]BCG49046.1 DnaJ-class molecular chaperone [Citrifermentans bremense]
MTYADLQEALRVLGLGERASLTEIKARHRELVKRHHPDAGGSGGDPDMIRRVNAANKVLQEYLAEYRFSFSEEEFYEQNPEERLRRQFMDAALWGKG